VLKECCVILTTTNEQNVVEQITNNLLEMSLANCIQVDNVMSYFRWQGKVSSQSEYRIVIKAKSENYNEIEKIITDLHNYDLPQIIKFDIQGGLPAYLNWITQNI